MSLGLSAAVIGMLLASAMALNRALNSSKIYADAYSDQRRVTDYIARDLRRGIGLAVTDSSGVAGYRRLASTILTMLTTHSHAERRTPSADRDGAPCSSGA